MALQDFKALTAISELGFQFCHRFVQPSLFRWCLAAHVSAISHAAQVEHSQVVLGLGREGEIGSSSQPNPPLPTVDLPLVWAHQGPTDLINGTYARTVIQWQELFWGVCSSWTFIGSIPAEDTCVCKHAHSHLLLFHQLSKQWSQGI